MRYFLFILLSIFSCEIFAQSFKTAKDLSPKNQKIYQKSVALYKTDEFEKAKKGFQKLIQKDPYCIDAFIQLGSIYYESSDFENAEINFKKAIDLSPDYNSKLYYTLALSNRQTKKYREAKINLYTFLQTEKKNQELLNKANELYPSFIFADSITQFPLQFQLKEMTIWNTLNSEYLPTITADGNTVVFTRRLNQNNEDLFITTRKDSVWSVPIALDEINSLYNEGAPAISPDGKSIIFTSCDIKESIGGCDLFISELVNGEWSQPRNLSREINTPAYESQANFADNGNTLYFVSNRKGSLGANDIWVTKLKKDKTWSKPKNLGKNVNTIKNEECPFMHPNGKTLFFSSDGLPGMGGKDIYYCIKDTSNNWSEPINLGYPLNSTLHEASFITDIQGINAYYASDFKYENIKDQNILKQKNLDLFSFILPESKRPQASSYIHISVIDELTKAPIQAHVEIFDLINKELFFSGNTTVDGQKTVVLPTGSSYAMHIKKENYLFDNSNFNCIENGLARQDQNISRYLKQIKNHTNKAIVLNNIFFEFGSAVLKNESEYELSELYQSLSENSKLKIKILGHTDNIGSEESNLNLSQMRANAVKDYLIKKGIQQDRLSSEGKGELQPIDSNENEEGRKNNRRTEFIIIEE